VCRSALARHPRWTFHFTPTSASWLNAVEEFFVKLTRQRLKRGVFQSVVDLPLTINRFVATPEGKKELVGLVGRSRKSGWPSPAFNALVETWGYEKAVECLTNEREALVYDLPVK
jgi:hypothetical protein